jgi:hypothetical protein
MNHGRPRPAKCEPGSLNDAREQGKRLRLSRERLANSELARLGQAWRLWAVCVDATFGYAREADQTYVVTLAAAAAGMDRKAAGRLLRQFDELGVFGWKAAPRGSHAISELSLPALMWSRDPMKTGSSAAPQAGGPTRGLGAALQSNRSMNVEVITHNSVERSDSLTL